MEATTNAEEKAANAATLTETGASGTQGSQTVFSGPVLAMEGITKSYPGVRALNGVSLDVRPGEVLALMGENGAGKSTLMKILAGAEKCDAGTISIDGKTVAVTSTQKAIDLGISIIYQEFNLVPHMTVAENIFLGHLPKGKFPGTLGIAKMRSESRRLLDTIGAPLDVDAKISSLSVAQMQMVEIAKATSRSARVIAMDEPSATLTGHELEHLFSLIEKLKANGVAIIYISHRMEEVFRIADRITILRDGTFIGTVDAKATSMEQLVTMMIGRKLEDTFPKSTAVVGDEVLSVTGLSRRGALKNVGFSVRAGEVVALAGLVGSGRTEIARCVFGADRFDAGAMTLNGKPYRPNSPLAAIRAGVGLVTEDRKHQGLILSQSVRANESLAALWRYAVAGFIRSKAERDEAKRLSEAMRVKTPSVEQRVGTLSGGNQQKVVLAKWLATKSKLLILDEPTRGIDIGAKREIYELMNRLTAEGTAILMISSELPEVLGMADRIVVMRNGSVAGELSSAEATQESVGRLALAD